MGHREEVITGNQEMPAPGDLGEASRSTSPSCDLMVRGDLPEFLVSEVLKVLTTLNDE